MREAAITALKEFIEANNKTPMEQLGDSGDGQTVESASCRVYQRHFDTAFEKIIPSVSEKVRRTVMHCTVVIFMILCGCFPTHAAYWS